MGNSDSRIAEYYEARKDMRNLMRKEVRKPVLVGVQRDGWFESRQEPQLYPDPDDPERMATVDELFQRTAFYKPPRNHVMSVRIPFWKRTRVYFQMNGAGITMVLLTYCTMWYCKYCFLNLALPSFAYGDYWDIGFYWGFQTCFYLCLMSHVYTMISDPGCISLNLQPNEDNVKTLRPKVNERVYKCRKCDTLRPVGTHHCNTCERCVFKMDHHCLCVNNCVGFLNQRTYLQFHLLLAVCSWLVFSVGYQKYSFCGSLENVGESGSIECFAGHYPVIAGLMLVVAVLVAFVAFLLSLYTLLMQVNLVLQDSTTVDTTFPQFADDGEEDWPKTTRKLSRLRDLCGRKPHTWFLPFTTNPRKSDQPSFFI